MSAQESRPRRQLSTSPFNRPAAEPVEPVVYNVDDRVTHDKYGLGTVVAVESRAAIVNFGAETRKIALPNPKLSPL